MHKFLFSSLIISLFTFSACRKTGPKMPNFTFEIAEGKPFAKANLKKEKNSIFIFFHPTCEHCENEATALAKAAKKFKNTDIYWISKAEWSAIQHFDSTYLLTQNGMQVLRDANGDGKTLFKVSDIPNTFVYDTYQELVVEYMAEVPVKNLLEDVGSGD
jgi:peroxiredoxin